MYVPIEILWILGIIFIGAPAAIVLLHALNTKCSYQHPPGSGDGGMY